MSADEGWQPFARKGYFPIARMVEPSQPLQKGSVVALAPDGERLRLVGSFGIEREPGPTLGELILYLALGWRKRTAIEEHLVQALMLKAKVRTG